MRTICYFLIILFGIPAVAACMALYWQLIFVAFTKIGIGETVAILCAVLSMIITASTIISAITVQVQGGRWPWDQ